MTPLEQPPLVAAFEPAPRQVAASWLREKLEGERAP
jgi:hypothetical protein